MPNKPGRNCGNLELLFNPARLASIDLIPFVIVKPAPFLKVAHRGRDVINQKTQLTVGPLSVVVVDFGVREINRFEPLVDATAQIEVLKIHEVPFIKETHPRKRFTTQHHEATGKVCDRKPLTEILIP